MILSLKFKLHTCIQKAGSVCGPTVFLHERLSKYLRLPSGDRASALDTQLHPSGNFIIEDF